MSDRPILFSAPMVRAILAGTKTQTRRVVKPQPQPNGGEGLHPVKPYACPDGRWNWVLAATGMGGDPFWGPYLVGDTLWVRETFSRSRLNPHYEWWHWADGNPEDGDWFKPQPSIHMPRAAARIFLRVTAVRCERLQEISEADAKAEGVEPFRSADNEVSHETYSNAFAGLWASINAERAPWSSNPWVWAITFERIDQ